MGRIALSLLLTVGLAVPAFAAENPCATVEITHEDGHKVTSRDYEEGAPLTSIVGYFLLVSWTDNPTGGDEWTDTLSFDITNADGAVACADGSVTITEQETPVEAPTPEAPEAVSLAPVCDVYRSSLGYVCELPNLTLTIS